MMQELQGIQNRNEGRMEENKRRVAQKKGTSAQVEVKNWRSSERKTKEQKRKGSADAAIRADRAKMKEHL